MSRRQIVIRFFLVLAAAGFLAVPIVRADSAPAETQTAQASHASERNGAPVDYTAQIKPLLAKHCVACHGPDEQESGLRVDAAALILRGGDRGPAVVPGDPANSLLHQVLTGIGDVAQMPAESDKLSPAEIELVRRWIADGAMAPEGEAAAEAGTSGAGKSDHWSFQPIRRPAVPAVVGGAGLHNAIDNFVRARLKKEGVAASPEADRVTLIRRLSLDLRGLPPSTNEVARFLADDRPDAYERLVDRFLASPAFGERWGRHWLDVARYADSNGFTIDSARSIWKYRDWVIDALNRDLPFDRFTIEQLAGDLLPDATTEQIVATGFHRNTLINQEGGTDQEQFRVDAVADRVNTTGAAWLGLTVGCARCHKHKYDPVSQREYYELFAIFNNCDEPTLDVPSQTQKSELARIDREIAAAEKPLKTHDAEFLKGLPAWENEIRATLGLSVNAAESPAESPTAANSAKLWTNLKPANVSTEKGAVLNPLDDDSIYVDFSAPPQDVFTIIAKAPLTQISAVRLEALTHPSLPKMGPGYAANGNFVLTGFELLVESPEPQTDAARANTPPVKLVDAVADHSQEGHPVADAIDGDVKTGWAINVTGGNMNVDREAIFFPAEPLQLKQGARVAVRLRFESPNNAKYLLGHFRLSVSDASRDALAIPSAVRTILAKPADTRTDAENDLLTASYQRTDESRRPLADRVARLKKQREAVSRAVPTTMVLRARKTPRQTHIHIRGDFLRKGAKVAGDVPAVLPPLPEGSKNPARLDFARWLVNPQNPLTARVTVNRAWQRFFGTGLVHTENDFGKQGARPSHPQLLDWLAAEFVDPSSPETDRQIKVRRNVEDAAGIRKVEDAAGILADAGSVAHDGGSCSDQNPRAWSMKSLCRLIVTSAVYRQSSDVRPELESRDPANRLLARQRRIRLDAEIVRDVALAASGLITEHVGGPSVFPPHPGGLDKFTQNPKNWKADVGPDRFRRGMYTHFWRSSPHPFLMTFDAPEANTACTRRVRSNTPLQALTLANDAGFMEIARGLAARILKESPPCTEGRLQHAFGLCLSREPSGDEARVLAEYHRTQQEHYEQSPEEAKRFAPPDVKTVDGTTIPPAVAAAWTSVARVLLNVDEFITRE